MAKHCQQPTGRLDVHAGFLQRLPAFWRSRASRRAHCPALSPPEHGAGGQQRRNGKRMRNTPMLASTSSAATRMVRGFWASRTQQLPGGDGSLMFAEAHLSTITAPFFYNVPHHGAAERSDEREEDGDNKHGHAHHGVGIRPACRPCAVRGAARACRAHPRARVGHMNRTRGKALRSVHTSAHAQHMSAHVIT